MEESKDNEYGMMISCEHFTTRDFLGAAIWLLVVCGGCSKEDSETKGENPKPQSTSQEEVAVVCFDVSRSSTPEAFQAWKCDLKTYILKKFKCGSIEIMKITKDSFIESPRIFEIKCPKEGPWQPQKNNRERIAEEHRIQREKKEVLEYIDTIQSEADDTDIQGALIRAKEDLHQLIQRNPGVDKKVWHIYSDFQARLDSSHSGNVGSDGNLSDIAVHLIFGCPQPRYSHQAKWAVCSITYKKAIEKWTPLLLRIGFSEKQLDWKLVSADCNQLHDVMPSNQALQPTAPDGAAAELHR